MVRAGLGFRAASNAFEASGPDREWHRIAWLQPRAAEAVKSRPSQNTFRDFETRTIYACGGDYHATHDWLEEKQ